MILQRSKSKLVTIIIHILVWAVFGMLMFFFQPLSLSANVAIPYQLWVKQSIILIAIILAFYFNSFVLVPRLLLRNRIALYLLAVVIVITGIVMISSYADRYLNIRQLMMEAFHRSRPHTPGPRPQEGPPHKGMGIRHEWDFAMIATSALVIGIGTSITTVQKWQHDKQQNQELEQERVTSELAFLKAQINPHFFFNTLNNIYALMHVDADTSRSAIHKLSRMMRYVLYDTQKTTTLLSQEIAFIRDYINLMQLRLTEAVKIVLELPEQLNDMPIAPMLFLPFIENAFKHGVSVSAPGLIRIGLKQEGKTLEFTVMNTVFADQNSSLEEGKGIGLANTRRRLELLYSGKYNLKINGSGTNDVYKVTLTLDI